MGRAVRGFFAVAFSFFTLLTLSSFASSKDDANSLVITFKDGHQQTISLTEVARIEFKSVAGTATKIPVDLPSRRHFVGKWTVGDGEGHTYYFTLEENGDARNTVENGQHGKWEYINGEAHVTWDNGWHDIIRKTGMKYRKFAFEPGKSLDDPPTNEGSAQKTNAEPI